MVIYDTPLSVEQLERKGKEPSLVELPAIDECVLRHHGVGVPLQEFNVARVAVGWQQQSRHEIVPPVYVHEAELVPLRVCHELCPPFFRHFLHLRVVVLPQDEVVLEQSPMGRESASFQMPVLTESLKEPGPPA